MYEEKIEALEKEKKTLIRKHKETEQELEKERDIYYKELEPFEKKIQEIKDKYEAREGEGSLSFLDEKEKKLKSRIDYHIPREIKDLKDIIKLDEAKKEGKHNEVSVTAFMDLIEVDYERIIEKKQLSNGVQIFRVSKFDYIMWLAFKGTNFMGLSYRRSGRHRGDETKPFSYIGGLDEKHLTKVDRKNRWGTMKNVNATFTDWKNLLSGVVSGSNYFIEITEEVKKSIKKAEDLNGECWDY